MEKKIESAILKQGMISFLESREPQEAIPTFDDLIVEDMATCIYEPEPTPENVDFLIL